METQYNKTLCNKVLLCNEYQLSFTKMYEKGHYYVVLVSSVPWQNRLDSLLTQDRISD